MGGNLSELRRPPAGYCITVKRWLSNAKLGKGRWFREYKRGKPVLIRRPKGLEHPVHWRLRFPKQKKIRQRNVYLAAVPKGRVVGSSCAVITPDHMLLWDVSRERGKSPYRHSIFAETQLPPVQQTDRTVAVLYIKDSGVYYHWMLDVLPKLKWMRDLRIKPDRYVINGHFTAPFQYETLEYLGIPQNRVIESRKNMHLQAERLIVSGFTGGIRAKWTFEFLRKEFLRKTTTWGKRKSEGERIYISRRKANKRKLLNEEEVVRLLERRGFRRVDLERTPVTEQARLFHSAEAIVAPHGAGLTNLVFSRPGTKVVELFSPNHVHPCYATISSLMGLDHYYLIGTGKRPPEYVNPQDRADNITADLKDLRRLLRMAGI